MRTVKLKVTRRVKYTNISSADAVLEPASLRGCVCVLLLALFAVPAWFGVSVFAVFRFFNTVMY